MVLIMYVIIVYMICYLLGKIRLRIRMIKINLDIKLRIMFRSKTD